MAKWMNKYWLEVIYISSVLCFVVVLSLVSMQEYATTMSQGLSENVIRFHVLANSDTKEDQLLKENVRDAVLLYMEPVLKDSPGIDETRKRITEHMDEIAAVAQQVIANWGKDYSVQVELKHEDFPTKTYGDIVFPAGNYEACRILIGEGKGQNWWCVMFPPLCYVDAATGVVPLEGKEALQENLTDEQYEIVSFQADKPYDVRFKIVEWFGK
ncbi:MAG: stage II sporulation protein R [Niameybacter sp.]|uniref:stage II sporulation protein R n=1 Tax=Niameybacter sp. TaxID=2033640 RepID=UPI002FC5B7FF